MTHAVPGVSLGGPVQLTALAARHGGTIDDAARDRTVSRLAPADVAADDALAPLTSRRYLAAAVRGRAVLLVDPALSAECPGGRRWVHPRPLWVLARMLEEVERASLAPAQPEIARGARIGQGAVVMPGAVVGEDCVIGPNAVVYGRVRLGRRVVIGAGAVLGGPGFGWAEGPSGELARIPHLGGLVVEDDVHVGPLCTIDAGALVPTWIGRGARLDAQVHVGHNVRIGHGVLAAAQSGFAGSVRIGDGVLVGGQAGVADHVTVGEGARLAAKSGVIGDVPERATVAGYPAVARVRWLRAMAALLRLSSRS